MTWWYAVARRRRRDQLEADRAEIAAGEVAAHRAAIGPDAPVPLRQATVRLARDRGAALPSVRAAEVSRRQMARHRAGG